MLELYLFVTGILIGALASRQDLSDVVKESWTNDNVDRYWTIILVLGVIVSTMAWPIILSGGLIFWLGEKVAKKWR